MCITLPFVISTFEASNLISNWPFFICFLVCLAFVTSLSVHFYVYFIRFHPFMLLPVHENAFCLAMLCVLKERQWRVSRCAVALL